MVVFVFMLIAPKIIGAEAYRLNFRKPVKGFEE